MGYGLRYEYGIFKQTIVDGWQREQPDNWLRRPDPWEVVRLEEAVEVKLNCTFELREGQLRPIIGRPSVLLGIPFDRPVVGYGGKTINTLRLWAAAAPDTSTSSCSAEAISWGRSQRRSQRNRSHACCTRTTRQSRGKACAFCRNIFWWPARWPISCAVFAAGKRRIGAALPEKVAIQLNDTHPTMAVPELMRILARRGAPRMG